MPFERFPCKLQKHALVSLLSPDLRATGAAAPKLVADIEPIEHVLVDDLEIAEAIAVLQHELEKAVTGIAHLDAGGQGGNFKPPPAGSVNGRVESCLPEGAYSEGGTPNPTGLEGPSLKIWPLTLACG